MAKKHTAKNKSASPVESIRHKAKGKDIPTEELRDFVTEDENAPKTVLYPRDPSLNAQLVWKSKAAKVATGCPPCVPAVNNGGVFGRWDSTEIDDPWDAKNEVRTSIQKGTEL